MLRRLKAAVASELPPKREVVLRVPPSAYQAGLLALLRSQLEVAAAGAGGGGGGGGGAAPWGGGSVRGVTNVAMELRCLCNHPLLR